jgi:hypothetical protein
MLATDLPTTSNFDLGAFLQVSARLPAVVEQAALEEWRDDGLAHNHHWATAQAPASCAMTRQAAQPCLVHAAAMRTPSCAVHDDIHYGRD